MYPRYSFITYGWYAPNWWVPLSTSTLECTRANIESVLHYSIAVLQHQFGTNCDILINFEFTCIIIILYSFCILLCHCIDINCMLLLFWSVVIVVVFAKVIIAIPIIIIVIG